MMYNVVVVLHNVRIDTILYILPHIAYIIAKDWFADVTLSWPHGPYLDYW
jgi:hypothetical protein